MRAHFRAGFSTPFHNLCPNTSSKLRTRVLDPPGSSDAGSLAPESPALGMVPRMLIFFTLFSGAKQQRFQSVEDRGY